MASGYNDMKPGKHSPEFCHKKFILWNKRAEKAKNKLDRLEDLHCQLLVQSVPKKVHRTALSNYLFHGNVVGY